jgi:radical SAM protein with 4Fe4S-binding SPASM domain
LAGIKTLSKFVLSRLTRAESWQRAAFRMKVRYVGRERPGWWPTKLQIEASSRCNLHCTACSRARELGGGEDLTEEKLRRILDSLPWSPGRVVLSGIGEPLMNPAFFSLVDILAERKIRCEFYTNGTLLTEARQQAILSRSNIDVINISCDGSRKETFESLRVGADFDKWKRSVQDFVLHARQVRDGTLSIGLNVVISKKNLQEMGDILRLATEWRLDIVYILDLVLVDQTTTALSASDVEILAAGKELARLAASLGQRVAVCVRRSASAPRLRPTCLQPWNYVGIRTNGDVVPCCAVFGSDRLPVMGNLFQQDFRTIWHGERYREFRRSSFSGINELCRICPCY